MAPSWVLLDRCLSVSHDEAVFAGETEGGREVIGCTSKGREGLPSEGEYRDAITAYLRSLKPSVCLADPPKLSSLSLLRPTESIPPLCHTVASACISSADMHLVALYAGLYRPGYSERGCFLIYDGRDNFLSTIPRLPFNRFHVNMGRHTAVIMSSLAGDYTLAEIVRVRSSDVAAAELYLWYSSIEEWDVKAVSLPNELCKPGEHFSADLCFQCRGTFLCWVDLLKGILVCDMSKGSSDPKFRFVPLPKVCTYRDMLDAHRTDFLAEVFRSMACVGGVIKFVSMEGYQKVPIERQELTLWTLSSDLLRWDKTKVYPVSNIWSNETYKSTGLGKIHPSLPVLSMHEDDVVYLVYTHIRQGANGIPEFKGQYVVRVEMENMEVQISQASTEFIIHSQLFASEFSAFQQWLVDSPVHKVVLYKTVL